MVQNLKLNIYLKISEFVKYTYRNAEIEYFGYQSAEDDKRQTRKLQVILWFWYQHNETEQSFPYIASFRISMLLFLSNV